MTPTNTKTILLAEEDDAMRAFLADNLAADRYEVLIADCRAKAMALLSVKEPDVIVVDVNGDTLELVNALRSGDGLAGRADPDTPLIVLTAQADELHRVRVLERGGDDVVSKPFSYLELRARIVALLRRAEHRQSPRVLCAGPVRIDLRSREVRVGDRPVELRTKEYELLVALAAEPTRVYSTQELLRHVWGFRATGTTRTLHSHASRLRQKLSDEGQELVVNVWGVGFCLYRDVTVSDEAAPQQR